MSIPRDRGLILYDDFKTSDLGHISIHYLQSVHGSQELYVLDKQTNEIKYFTSRGADLQTISFIYNHYKVG